MDTNSVIYFYIDPGQ